jgi:Cutinase
MNIRRVRIHRIAGSLCAATLALASPIGVPSAGADGCPDIEVFARGTDEPPVVGSVGQAFINSLRSKVGGRSVGQYAVNYAGCSAPPPLPPEAADHVAAVAVFGNPADKMTGSIAGLPVYGGRSIDLCTEATRCAVTAPTKPRTTNTRAHQRTRPRHLRRACSSPFRATLNRDTRHAPTRVCVV